MVLHLDPRRWESTSNWDYWRLLLILYYSAAWNGGLWFVWCCACLPGSSYKKPTSEIFSAARTPRRENRPPTCSELIWEEQVSLTANLLSSTTTASAGVVSILAALAATCLVFLPSGESSRRWLPEVGLRPRYLTSKPCFPCSGSLC